MQVQRILLTGGNGFLGSYVRKKLADKTVFAPRSRELNLLDKAAVDQYVAENGINAIIHCAGFVGGIGLHREHPGRMIADNLRMGLNVLEAAAGAAPAHVVIVSTICVYPADASVPTAETAMFEGEPAEDTGFYGIAKRTLLTAAQGLQREFGLTYSYLIPTNLYGPGDYDDESRSHVVSALIKRILAAKESGAPEVVVWGDGTNTRDFAYVEDTARAVAACLNERAQGQVFNFGAGREISIRELAETICELAGYTGKLVFDPTKPSGAKRRALDSSKIASLLGIRAQVDLRTGLKNTMESLKKEILNA